MLHVVKRMLIFLCLFAVVCGMITFAAAETDFWHDSATNQTDMENKPYAYADTSWGVQGDTVYFFDEKGFDGAQKLYRLDTTGLHAPQAYDLINPATGERMLEAHCIMPVGDTVYFTSNATLWALALETGDVSAVREGVSAAWYSDGWFYVSSRSFGHHTWIRLNGSTEEIVLDMADYAPMSDDYDMTFNMNNAFFCDGYIYIAGNAKDPFYTANVYRVAMDGSECTKIIDADDIGKVTDTRWIGLYDVESMCIHQGQLYLFVEVGEERNTRYIVRCNPDGSNLEYVSGEYPSTGVGYVDGYYWGDALFDFSDVHANTSGIDWEATKRWFPHMYVTVDGSKMYQTSEWHNGGYTYLAFLNYGTRDWCVLRCAHDGSNAAVVATSADLSQIAFKVLRTPRTEGQPYTITGIFTDKQGGKVYFYDDGVCLNMAAHGTVEESTYVITESGDYRFNVDVGEAYEGTAIVKGKDVKKP